MIIALMCSSFVFALPYDLKINNICYKIIGDEAMVTVPSDNEEQNHRFYTGKIDIPETISYGLKTYKVTSIGKGAFAYCQDVTEIFVPNSVVTIGDGAFMESNKSFGLRRLNISEVMPWQATKLNQWLYPKLSRLWAIGLLLTMCGRLVLIISRPKPLLHVRAIRLMA